MAFTDERAYEVLTWPNSSLLGVVRDQRIDIFDAGRVDDVVADPVQSLDLESLGYGDQAELSSVVPYSSGLAILMYVDGESMVVFFDLDGNQLLPPAAAPFNAQRLAVGADRIALGDYERVYLAHWDGSTWQWTGPIERDNRSVVPLAVDDDAVFLGVSELYDPGGGGAAGAGGADSGLDSTSARLERVSESGSVVESYETVGNPSRLVRIDGGWLVTETNSFWGSYDASLEWLPPGGDALREVAGTPVISAGDGEDGAFDAAIHGNRLYVANCESGLLSGVWSEQSFDLQPVSAYPSDGYSCDPRRVGIASDLLVATGDHLFMARFCPE